jgi:hypothetical protein
MFACESGVWRRGVLAVTPTEARHSAAQYDFKTPLVVRGSVKEIRVANPHIRLVLYGSDNKAPRGVELEGYSLNNIRRQG